MRNQLIKFLVGIVFFEKFDAVVENHAYLDATHALPKVLAAVPELYQPPRQ